MDFTQGRGCSAYRGFHFMIGEQAVGRVSCLDGLFASDGFWALNQPITASGIVFWLEYMPSPPEPCHTCGHAKHGSALEFYEHLLTEPGKLRFADTLFEGTQVVRRTIYEAVLLRGRCLVLSNEDLRVDDSRAALMLLSRVEDPKTPAHSGT